MELADVIEYLSNILDLALFGKQDTGFDTNTLMAQPHMCFDFDCQF